ncbi:hypothetical protein, partial [Streptomyces mirabilis]|uniref:hypothetical protein n=1 Tax=Streptomyces mirabilis TaxID=68239 RepID=UPI003404A5B9
MGILIHKALNRAYRSIERGKSNIQGCIRTRQELSAPTAANRMTASASADATNYLFFLNAAKFTRREIPQTVAQMTRTSS